MPSNLGGLFHVILCIIQYYLISEKWNFPIEAIFLGRYCWYFVLLMRNALDITFCDEIGIQNIPAIYSQKYCFNFNISLYSKKEKR